MFSSVLWSGCVAAPSLYHLYQGASNLSEASHLKSRIRDYARARPLLDHGFPATEHFKKLFAQEPGLRRDIWFYPVIDQPYAAATGANFGSAATIIYNPKLRQINEKTFRVVCLHELSHVLNSDILITRGVAALSAAVSAYATPYFLTLFPASIVPLLCPAEIAIPFALGMMAWNMRTRTREDAADDFAFRHAENDELQEYEGFAYATIEAQKELHVTYPNLFSSDGTQRTENAHSLDNARLAKVQAELERRGLPRGEFDETKINEMKAFVKSEFLAGI